MLRDTVVEFDCNVQTLSALQAAAYRLIGSATCEIEKQGNRWKCSLASRASSRAEPKLDGEALRLRFLDLVTDENVREGISAKTEPVRNLILALAFGSLASEKKSDVT